MTPMTRIEPSHPFHISRAYQAALPPVLRVRPVAIDPIGADQRPGASRLVAGMVKGRVDFSGGEPRASGEALAMYRHPADRNAAATGVHAGRMIDVTG